ncbi:MAG: RIP metalloprotease RseP [Alistipes sp.]|nr:RIP metalloprotease RseP [Alistipes sp.]
MEVILIKTLQFFASLSLLVMLHEFGHYITARIFKIRVEQFYIFFNPWFSLYKRKVGDTVYGIGWLPLGGYVSLAGMIDESIDKKQVEDMKQPAQPWEFRSKPAWQRLIVMLAGVVMNIIAAMVIYTGVLYTWGESYVHNDDVRYGYLFDEAAENAGFQDGDRIVAINGEGVERISDIVQRLLITDADAVVEVLRGEEKVVLNVSLEELVAMRESGEWSGIYNKIISAPYLISEVTSNSALEAGLKAGDRIVAINGTQTLDRRQGDSILMECKGASVVADVERDGEVLQLTLPINDEGKIGITIEPLMIELRTHYYGFWESIPAGVRYTGEQIASYWDQLKMIVNPDTKMYKELGGFIAIGNVFPDEWNWQSFWNITALLSIMLAVMNLLPIPGLDGGHSLFTLWEIITRRKPSDKFLVVVQWIGMGILFALLLYANGNDILRFIF